VLISGLLVHDNTIAIDEVFLHFMGQYTLQWCAPVRSADLIYYLSYVTIMLSWLHQPVSSLDAFVSSQHNVSFAILHFSLAHNHSMSHQRNEPIDMHAKLSYYYL
jgi:hypothetical protein